MPWGLLGVRALAPSHVFRESGTSVEALPRRPLEEEHPPILQRRRLRFLGPLVLFFLVGLEGPPGVEGGI